MLRYVRMKMDKEYSSKLRMKMGSLLDGGKE
jgi:hypothetical protein